MTGYRILGIGNYISNKMEILQAEKSNNWKWECNRWFERSVYITELRISELKYMSENTQIEAQRENSYCINYTLIKKKKS